MGTVCFSKKDNEYNNCKFNDIPEATKKIVFGFIKIYTEYLNNIYISIDIKSLIISYYYINFEFYTKEHGKYLEFLDNKIVKKTFEQSSNIQISLCIFGEEITDKICERYSIFVKILSKDPSLRIGYVSSMQYITDWSVYNIHTMYSLNKGYALFGIGGSNKKFYFEGPDYKSCYLNGYESHSKFKKNDIIGLIFDFNDNNIRIYHNKNEAGQVSLNNDKTILPIIGIWAKTTIQVIRAELH
eukprot:431715_1